VEFDLTLDHLARGLVLVVVTVGLQLLAQVTLYKAVKVRWAQRGSAIVQQTSATLIAVFVLLTAVILQVIAWAFLYFSWSDPGSFANCLYFSFASYTTVGAADVMLSPAHRMLGTLEAAMGMLIFGWSTALLVRVINVSSRNPPE